jgi:hypothetical protein
MRLWQSLEITDGPWELVPVVVAATEAHGQRPAAEVADSLPVARMLATEGRARLRELGDTLSDITTTAGGPAGHGPVTSARSGEALRDIGMSTRARVMCPYGHHAPITV